MSPTRLLLTSALLLLAACETPLVVSPDVSPDAGSDVDTAALDVADGGVPLVACDPAFGSLACLGDQRCEATARVCVDCVFDMARCNADGEREICPKPNATAPGQLSGGFWQPDPCATLDVCNPASGACETPICTPGVQSCKGAVHTHVCNEAGTAYVGEVPCSSGKACYEGECQRVRQNVLVVFDTSSSMHTPLDPASFPPECETSAINCLDDFPVCDGPPGEPRTLFSLSKRAFAEVLAQSKDLGVQYALQRFPQVELTTYGAGNCHTGWYKHVGTMTGDAGEHDTSKASWFGKNLGEAIFVPFPRRASLSNAAELQRWLDFQETRDPVPAPGTPSCSGGIQCGLNACVVVDGQEVCVLHDNPELRAAGQTPLGKSLFYAGEYFRRFVLVDGKPCGVSSDCESTGYVCVEGACRDPFRHCRDNFVVLFTDGGESDFQSEADFFNPAVQAKRLAFGLGCATTADCRGGASCVQGICLGPNQTVQNVPGTVDLDGHGALSRPDGSEVSIRTSVVNLAAGDGGGVFPQNARIALAGGGQTVPVTVTDLASLETALKKLLQVDPKCKPEEF
ncbi:MAG: hypothetical protein H6744_21075 [Deltaproteobacteria bacterium]|nr:hypothetical protein [Deltaproteobacteria bacterium]MCB9789177.1 hypothetical protein [Deltaproteobacteria bacterium]